MGRTVGVILKTATKESVGHWLDSFASGGGDNWAYPPDQEGAVLLIHIFQNIKTELEPEEYDDLVLALGTEPAVMVIAFISGRYPADNEARLFVTSILSQFEGFAFDEFTHHWWTRDEIVSDKIIDGFHYFDYMENYRRHHGLT